MCIDPSTLPVRTLSALLGQTGLIEECCYSTAAFFLADSCYTKAVMYVMRSLRPRFVDVARPVLREWRVEGLNGLGGLKWAGGCPWFAEGDRRLAGWGKCGGGS
jgi:hypothetical protein